MPCAHCGVNDCFVALVPQAQVMTLLDPSPLLALLLLQITFSSFFLFANFSGYPESWAVCSQLGQSEDFQDLATRQELMAFALTHCPPSSIELLLAASSSLQTEVSGHRYTKSLRVCDSFC